MITNLHIHFQSLLIQALKQEKTKQNKTKQKKKKKRRRKDCTNYVGNESLFITICGRM